MRFKGQVVLVTGSGRGIGAATALLFAHEGAHLFLVSRSKDQLKSIADQIRKTTHNQSEVGWLAGDVSEESFASQVFDDIYKRWGRLDIVINNAGTVSVENAKDTSLATWERTMAVNARGTFLFAREAFRRFGQGGGVILNVSSLAGIQGVEKFKGLAAYSASKSAVVGLTEALAVEGKELGIKVNCIAPGAVDTQMLREAAPFLKTNTKPEDLAGEILSLCDQAQNAGLTGTIRAIYSNQ